jgi:hypothetical protein
LPKSNDTLKIFDIILIMLSFRQRLIKVVLAAGIRCTVSTTAGVTFLMAVKNISAWTF